MASGGEVEEVALAEDEYEEGEEISISDVIDNHFPNFLVFGMTYDQYYNQDVELACAYREAFYIKRKLEFNESNQSAWLNGLYMHRALEIQTEKLSKTINGLFTKNIKKEIESEYPSKPFDFDKKEKEEEKKELTEEEIQKERENLFTMLSTMQKNFENNKK